MPVLVAESVDTGGKRTVYSVYGERVAGNFPFTVPLPSADGDPTLFVFVTDSPLEPAAWRSQPPTYQSRQITATGGPRLVCYDSAQSELLRFAGLADFYLSAGAIHCHILDRDHLAQIELHLLGTVMTRWMERQGVAMLHASAVIVDKGAVGFVATSRQGKSTLAAVFVQNGHELLSDDLLPLRIRGDCIQAAPGYPQMRFWPEQAEHFLDASESLPCVLPTLSKRRVPLSQVGLGVFRTSPCPLLALYLVQRELHADEEIGVKIQVVSPASALFSLVSHSFASRFVNAPVHQQERLKILRPILDRVPVRSLSYPSGNHYLSAVRQSILTDLVDLGLKGRD